MKALAIYFILAIIFFTLFIFPVQSAQQDMQVISSQGVINRGGKLGWLYTDGKFVKSESGEVVYLRGCAFIEPAYCVDELQHDWLSWTLADRAERFKELGVNFVRIPTHLGDWETNKDTNGNGVGHRDFVDQAIQEFTSRGIYVCPGLHYGLKDRERNVWANDPQQWIDWLINNLVNRYIDNPGVASIYILNEPQYDAWGGYSGWWSAAKECVRQIHEVNPNLLLIVHADKYNEEGFMEELATDLMGPNVVYTFHYYYRYCPTFNPYHPWGSGIPDPTYEDCKERGRPFYQSYYYGNYTQAKVEFEQFLYDKFLYAMEELNVPIICDEYGFVGNEKCGDWMRVCRACGWMGELQELLEAANGNRVQPPYDGDGYCPECGAYIENPQDEMEPGWSQCMYDFHEVLNRYYCSWSYYAWWGKVYGGYGLVSDDDMMTLSKTGEVWKDYLNASVPT